ncbi:hypothetical protein LTR27_004790 [Elasticomyces elasticus]|nr:hypothetical protein LTR27_004790 [Elasticomyces elasticus]
MAESSGALSPVEASQQTLQTGIHHLSESIELAFIKNVYGGMLLSAGGMLSLILGAGFKGASEENPGLQRLLQGSAFPIGLVLVYTVGAELFTGLPMWWTMTALARRGTPKQYILGTLTSWLGNLVGAVFIAALTSTFTGTLQQEPWRSGVISQVQEDIIDLPFHTIFLRAIGCGWLVTVAMFLGTQNKDGISKVLALHLPFLIATVARFPHTVEYMYLAAVGIMVGSPLGVGAYFWKCLLPITLGNTVGGSVFTGLYLWYVNLKRADDQKNEVPEGWESGRLGGDYHD